MRAAWAIAALALLVLAGCSGPVQVDPSVSGSATGKATAKGTTTSKAPTSGPGTSAPPTSSPGTTEGPTGSPSGPAPPPPPPPPHVWPDLGSARIRPGVQTLTDGGGQCTANFVFLSPDNATVYLGQAAHCASTGGPTDTNGCETASLALGTRVEVVGTDGREYPGTLAYSSWVTMASVAEGDADACSNNDFALIALSAEAAAVTHPAMLRYGGPVGMGDPGAIGFGDKVLTYGNSGLRFGVSQTGPKEGWVTTEPGSGWAMYIYTATPGVPGDSGSGVLDTEGRAIADLVTLSATTENGATILPKAVAYAQERGRLEVRLATWELLDDGLLPPL